SKVLYQPAEAGWWDPTPATHFRPQQMERVHALLPRLGLSSTHLNNEVRLLSTGERQRMALIRSLACEPQVLLLDEPTAALDPESVSAVQQLLQEELAKGMSLVLVTHSEDQARLLGRRRIRMENRCLSEWSGA
ncbi:MAG: ATP-binding cassette domain-containing protein, partial [Paucibacter sp.]|nr:ATP-binding cassette domain-containing protein [Roseateles sp.]